MSETTVAAARHSPYAGRLDSETIDEHSVASEAVAGRAGNPGLANDTKTITHGRLELRS
jgi:hypothetical protein